MLNKIWDKIGICASGLCLVHCLLTPILILAFPSYNFSAAKDDSIHEIFAVVIIISLMMAVYPTCRKHGHKDIVVFAALGIILILLGTFLHSLPETLSHIVVIAGSISLIIAHIKNMRVRHGTCESHCDDH